MNKLLRFLFILTLMVAGRMSFTACGDDDETKPINQPLEVTPNQVTFSSDGGEQTIMIITASGWSITSTTEWLTVTPSKGDGNTSITLKVSANKQVSERIAECVVLTKNEQVSISIRQQGLSETIDDDDDNSNQNRNDNNQSWGQGDEGVYNAIAVDLGLSVKWGDRNVGASRVENSGGYYAYGETTEKKSYSYENYKWCNGDRYGMTTPVRDKNVA